MPALRLHRRDQGADGAGRAEEGQSTPGPGTSGSGRGWIAKLQAEALKKSRWVGADFAEEARAIHYGEREAETIHGQATLEEAKELLEEGIAVMPLPLPVVPPDQAN